MGGTAHALSGELLKARGQGLRSVKWRFNLYLLQELHILGCQAGNFLRLYYISHRPWNYCRLWPSTTLVGSNWSCVPNCGLWYSREASIWLMEIVNRTCKCFILSSNQIFKVEVFVLMCRAIRRSEQAGCYSGFLEGIEARELALGGLS